MSPCVFDLGFDFDLGAAECSADVPDLASLLFEGVRSGTAERSGAARPALLGRGFPGHSGCTAPARAGAVVSGVVPGAVRPVYAGPGRSPGLGRALDPGFARRLLRGPSGAELPPQIAECADRRDPCAEESGNSFRDPIGIIENVGNTADNADNFQRCHVGSRCSEHGEHVNESLLVFSARRRRLRPRCGHRATARPSAISAGSTATNLVTCSESGEDGLRYAHDSSMAYTQVNGLHLAPAARRPIVSDVYHLPVFGSFGKSPYHQALANTPRHAAIS